jgi:hypothetical protein
MVQEYSKRDATFPILSTCISLGMVWYGMVWYGIFSGRPTYVPVRVTNYVQTATLA